jgi:hypothetical protein
MASNLGVESQDVYQYRFMLISEDLIAWFVLIEKDKSTDYSGLSPDLSLGAV